MVFEDRNGFGITERSGDPDGEVALSRHAKFNVIVDGSLECEGSGGLVAVSHDTTYRTKGGIVGDVELGGRPHEVSIHEVLEVLGVHLVSDLRERLPGLEEGRQVLHLPPQVEALVVDGGDVRVINGVCEGVVGGVGEVVRGGSSRVHN